MRRDPPPIAGARVMLRPLTPADLPVLWRWHTDPELKRLAGDAFAPPGGAGAWLQDLLINRRRRGFAVEAPGGRMIGELELGDINWSRGTAELRVCIGEKDCWGRGYGSDAVRAAVRYALHTLGLRSVYLRVRRDNRRAIRCYGRCGFRGEGILRAGGRLGDAAQEILLMTLCVGTMLDTRSTPRLS